ncbi:MAG: hypothetical protein Q8O88_00780 [bacterium]|nr:hypothetical protein [bacterium]
MSNELKYFKFDKKTSRVYADLDYNEQKFLNQIFKCLKAGTMTLNELSNKLKELDTGKIEFSKYQKKRGK